MPKLLVRAARIGLAGDGQSGRNDALAYAVADRGSPERDGDPLTHGAPGGRMVLRSCLNEEVRCGLAWLLGAPPRLTDPRGLPQDQL